MKGKWPVHGLLRCFYMHRTPKFCYQQQNYSHPFQTYIQWTS